MVSFLNNLGIALCNFLLKRLDKKEAKLKAQLLAVEEARKFALAQLADFSK